MARLDTLVTLLSAVVMIIGGYQIYFWCQRRSRSRARSFSFRLDNFIPRQPAWVWIYSGLYYPAVLWAVASARDFRHFHYMAFSYFVLLALHLVMFLIFPVEVPQEWRTSNTNASSVSERFLLFVQGLDGRNNCFPSMHVSVATLTAFHVASNVPSSVVAMVLFVTLIALSCIFTKQHYVIDIPGGVMLGWLSFGVFMTL